MSHRTYMTIKTTQVNAVDYEEVFEIKDTLRYSVDTSEFIIKWVEIEEGQIPDSLVAIPAGDKSSPMTHAEAKTLMASNTWTDPNITP